MIFSDADLTALVITLKLAALTTLILLLLGTPVAYSQVKRPGHPTEGSFWKVPQALYTPIKQQVVLLKDSETARAFLSFMRSDEALKIIHDYGYKTP